MAFLGGCLSVVILLLYVLRAFLRDLRTAGYLIPAFALMAVYAYTAVSISDSPEYGWRFFLYSSPAAFLLCLVAVEWFMQSKNLAKEFFSRLRRRQ